MALGKHAIKGGLAALMVMVMTVGAYAWTASATTTVNVRSGPGTQFRVVDVLHRGERVDVQYCRGSWCFVSQYNRGPNGWVSANFLSRGYAPPPPPSYRPPVRPQPPHWSPYPPRPPYWNPNPPRPPHWGPYPPRPPVQGQVCYNGPNGYFCVGN